LAGETVATEWEPPAQPVLRYFDKLRSADDPDASHYSSSAYGKPSFELK
jgi:hypothetical protein